MSGLDDTTEPAAQDAVPAQDPDVPTRLGANDEPSAQVAEPSATAQDAPVPDDLPAPSAEVAEVTDTVAAEVAESAPTVAADPEVESAVVTVAADDPTAEAVPEAPVQVEAATDVVQPAPEPEQTAPPAAVSEPPAAAAEPIAEPPAAAQPVSEPAVAPAVEAAAEAAPGAEPASAPTDPAETTPAPASSAEPAAAPTAAGDATPTAPPQPAAAAEAARAANPAAVPTTPEIGASAPAPEIGATAAPSGIAPPAKKPRPKAATDTGKIVEGLVTAVSADLVELTLDDGREAIIHGRNFSLTDEEPTAVLSIGDRVFGAELVREDPKSRVVLSRAWALKRRAWEQVVESSEKNELLQGKVVSASKKGLVVDVGVRGFVPLSHLELNAVTDVSPYVDQTLELKILEVDPRREKLVLSRRSLLLKAQRKEMQELMGSLKVGEVRTGTVASLADYGAFVDLGGVSGLVHISELSWKRVTKPSKVVSVGDQVEVKILDVKPKKKRISLSMRQVTPDPLSAIEVGAVVTGAVTRLVDFGAFVAIGEFEGLVHLSELAEYRVSTPEEIVAPGDEVGVKILSVDTKRRRIELSIRRAAEYGG